jgi:hypothetical protein
MRDSDLHRLCQILGSNAHKSGSVHVHFSSLTGTGTCGTVTVFENYFYFCICFLSVLGVAANIDLHFSIHFAANPYPTASFGKKMSRKTQNITLRYIFFSVFFQRFRDLINRFPRTIYQLIIFTKLAGVYRIFAASTSVPVFKNQPKIQNADKLPIPCMTVKVLLFLQMAFQILFYIQHLLTTVPVPYRIS